MNASHQNTCSTRNDKKRASFHSPPSSSFSSLILTCSSFSFSSDLISYIMIIITFDLLSYHLSSFHFRITKVIDRCLFQVQRLRLFLLFFVFTIQIKLTLLLRQSEGRFNQNHVFFFSFHCIPTFSTI